MIYWSIKYPNYGCDSEGNIYSSYKGSIKTLKQFKNSTGRLHISIGKMKIKSHRFIFETIKGYLPKYLDHINGDFIDNRIINLREATSQQNAFNRKCHKNNKIGVKGVHYHKGTIRASIMVDGVHINLGTFSDVESAASAYKQAALKYAGKFANY